jgi:HAD superfamily hydrolase (TIGR01509 family)
VAPGLALIFDLDGVIVNSNSVHALAWRKYLAQFGLDSAEIERTMFGKRNDEIVRELFGEDLPEQETAAHGAAKEAIYRDLMRPRLEENLVPGVRGFLTCLDGLPMAVASNAERPNIDFVLDSSGLARHFRAAFDGAQVERAKPAPDIFLMAADALGTVPANCIVFEDSMPGVRAALAAGMRVVGLQTTHPELPGVSLGVDDYRDPRLNEWLRAQSVSS